jgi:hypothetical protein
MPEAAPARDLLSGAEIGLKMKSTSNAGTKSIHTSPVATKKAACPTLASTLGALVANSTIASPQIASFATEEMLKGALAVCVLLDELVPYAFAAGACNWKGNDFGHRDREFHALLGRLSTASVQAGGGMITAAVVRSGQELPGDEFFQLWEQLRGRQVPIDPKTGAYSDAGKRAVWNEELVLLGMRPRT